MFHRANHAKNTFTIRNERTWHTHKPNCFDQKNYWHTERIKICVLFRIRIQNIFFIQTILSLQFLATLLPQFFFFPFRQQHCHKSIATFFFSFYFGNSIATNQLPQFFVFFPPIFSLNLLFSKLSCIKIPPPSSFLATSLPKLLLFLPKILATWLTQFFFFFLPFSATLLSQFLFFLSTLPYNFGNLVATISFPFEHSA